MKYAVLLVIGGGVVFLGLDAKGEQKVKPAGAYPNEATLRRVAAANDKDRLEILRQLGAARSKFESQLIKELGDAKETDKKLAFVYLMGLYRLEGTARELAKIIDLENQVVLSDAEALWDQYPVVEALVKIGKRSIPVMLENIVAGKSDLVTKLSVDVIQHAETPAIAKMILEDAIAKEKDPKKLKNLQDSLKHLKKS